uniref:Uncharacterized protein n=1 Tax=Siphoviridae sp. ct8LX107 TaxID=2826169 RepID=A0A8S5QQF5_9CAUD|nr:MAG TPA: hypothetical protein [Siphoviridae sp. ct8LX107]
MNFPQVNKLEKNSRIFAKHLKETQECAILE